MKKTFAAISISTSLFACSATERKEIVVSDMFNICMPATSEAKIAREIPVDVERATYEDKVKTMSLLFSHYPGDRSNDDVKSQYAIGGPLHVRALNETSANGVTVTIIEFDSIPGGVLSRAYGRVTYTAKSGSSVEMKKILASWHRCGSPWQMPVQ